ncbi:MAG: hypothetical protein ABL955_11445 [Elusimicrobiota bacterium]
MKLAKPKFERPAQLTLVLLRKTPWLALLLAAAVQAQEFDKPGFWNRAYSIPHHYVVTTITLDVRDGGAAVKQVAQAVSAAGGRQATYSGSMGVGLAGGRQFSWPPPNQSMWELPSGQAEKAVAAIAALGSKPRIKRDELGKPTEFADLDLKKSGLSLEAARVRRHLSELPGAVGLLDAQFTALEPLIARHERAKAWTLVQVILATPKLDPVYLKSYLNPTSSFVPLDAEAMPDLLDPDNAYLGRWRRTGYADTCAGRPSPLQADFLEEDPVKAAELLERASALLTGHGAVRVDIKCMPDSVNGIHYDDIVSRTGFLIEPDELEALKPKLDGLGRLIVWESYARKFWVDFHENAAVRLGVLTAELRDKRAVLEQMPMTRGLMADEIRRLTPYAERLKNAGSKVFFEVIVVRKKG